MNSKKLAIGIITTLMVVFYGIIVYNVFMGLLEAKVIEGFCGIILILMGLILVVLAALNLHKIID